MEQQERISVVEETNIDTNTNSESTNINSSNNENKTDFEKFVIYFEEINKASNVSWNKERDVFSKEISNKNRIILKELHQFE